MGEPAVDAEGYLVDPRDWNEAWAEAAAGREGVELTPLHWSALRFMRAFYDDHALPPDARFVIKHLTTTHGAGRNCLFELFPYGYAGQACRFAGMRRPRIWSTG
jgi:dissimilatory sulfite reductase related protein